MIFMVHKWRNGRKHERANKIRDKVGHA